MCRSAGLGALLALAATAVAAAVIEVSLPVVAGDELSIRLVRDGRPLAGVLVSATYNPRSEVAREEPLGTTAVDGRLRWRPRAAGLVRLEARVAAPAAAAPATVSRDLAVRFRRVPRSGLATLLTAAAVLVCGLFAGLRESAVPGPSRGGARGRPST